MGVGAAPPRRGIAPAPHSICQILNLNWYQIIWLLQLGKRTAEVSEVTGYSRAWIYEVVRSYNRQGPEALGDQRQHNQGNGQVILDDETQALLYQALQMEFDVYFYRSKMEFEVKPKSP